VTETIPQLDSESLVARIIDELQANPDAQTLLLRALLTQEFLGMPIRLERVEADVAELKERMGRVEADIAELKSDVAELKNDVASLKGDMMEMKLDRKVRPRIIQHLSLRQSVVVQSPVQEPKPEFFDQVDKAVAAGVINSSQEARLYDTDFILQARRRADGVPVWAAVEASNTIGQHDLKRVGQSAAALQAIFEQDVLAIAIGYHIHPQDRQSAEAEGIHIILNV